MTKKEIRAEITKLRKKLKAKPRGKAKGGQYERDVITMIVEAFKDRGITKDDCYRTPRGSKEGDIKCGSALRKIFPFTIEAKFYAVLRTLNLLQKVERMPKSFLWRKWWKQLEEEVKLTKQPGILVFRENNGVDLVSFYAKDVAQWPKMRHAPKLVTYHYKEEVWTMMFSRFLKVINRSF